MNHELLEFYEAKKTNERKRLTLMRVLTCAIALMLIFTAAAGLFTVKAIREAQSQNLEIIREYYHQEKKPKAKESWRFTQGENGTQAQISVLRGDFYPT